MVSPFPTAVELAVLSVDKLIARADGAPLCLHWEEAEIEDIAEQASPSAAPLYSSTPDDDEERPFAAALRKASGKRANR